jgi:hypothetical protein
MGSLRTLRSDSKVVDDFTRLILRLKREFPSEFESTLNKYRQSRTVGCFKVKARLRDRYDLGRLPVGWMETADRVLSKEV